MKQLVFIDDSGDPGFIQGTSSHNLVMAGAIFVDPEEATKINKAISDFRRKLGWDDTHEFKFRKASKDIKIRFFELVKSFDFEIYAVYIDKTKYPNAFRFADREKLYNWTTKELLKIMPLENAYVSMDGRSSKKNKLRVASYLRKEINIDAIKVKQFKTQDSSKDNMIQLADMLVGAIHRSLMTDKTDHNTYIDIIKDKVKIIKALELQ